MSSNGANGASVVHGVLLATALARAILGNYALD
jgi:hypothetical protein